MIPLCRPLIGEEEKQAVMRVLDSGQLAQGPMVAALEKEMARRVGTEYAVVVSSGTAALFLALRAHGVRPGDRVITTPFSFVATASSIMMCGAKPLFVDIGRDYNLNEQEVQRVLNLKAAQNVRAILPVHLYGLPANLGRLQALAAERGISLIEDCAQALGARFGAHSVGAYGTGCFSLYATKNICAGEGGVVTTNDPKIAANVRMLRQHGPCVRPYEHLHLGYNYRMTDMQAALALAQLGRLEDVTAARNINAAYYNTHLDPKLTRHRPCWDGNYRHAWHQYTLDLDRRDTVRQRLTDAGVGTGLFYPLPLNKQPLVLEEHGYHACPEAERAAERVLQIPVGPHLTDEDRETIVREVNAAVNS